MTRKLQENFGDASELCGEENRTGGWDILQQRFTFISMMFWVHFFFYPNDTSPQTNHCKDPRVVVQISVLVQQS